MPDLTELAPLPEVPEVPESPPPAPAAITQTSPTPRQHAAVETMRRPSRPATGNPTTAGGSPATGGNSGGNSGGGSGMSNAARLAAGSMPSPAYPAEARRLGQTGTLVVEFTIDASGRVISARAKSPSPWPLLNQEAVRAVRRWRFPPGPVMTLQRPIVFQLR
jgi:protein TonB